MKYLFFVLIWVLNLYAFSQNKLINKIYDEATNFSTVSYSMDTNHDFLTMESAFSEGSVEVVPIKDQRITSIDLVYTEYRESKEFSQETLSKNRIARLIEVNPQLIDNQFFDWRLVKQTGCSSSESCRDFFHGFVIYYDRYYTKEDTRKEIDTIKQDLSEFEAKITKLEPYMRINFQDLTCQFPPLNASITHITDEFKKYYDCDERYSGKVFFEVQADDKGRPVIVDIKGTLFPCREITENILKHILRWKRGLTIGSTLYPFTAKGMIQFPLQRESITLADYTISESLTKAFNVEVRGVTCSAFMADTFYTDIIPKIQKEAVSTVLFRNNWEDDLIIVDATGSMYPYTSDLLKWMRLQSTQEDKTFVFFNDGDDKPTLQKSIGHTGGIYHVVTADYVAARNVLFESMKKGGGGDLYENNFEALLYGVKKSGINSGAIMIADNHSFPRDYELVEGYQGDLKIILCGTEKGVNTNYLNLARHYGFSIHTFTSDLNNLSKLNIGQSISIGDQKYILSKNGFNRLIQ